MPSSSLQQVSHCTKNPGHEDFIALKEFSPQHLRAVRQKAGLYDLIKCQGALTLQIKSSHVKKVKGVGKSSKGSEKHKKVRKRSTSTGFVIWVNKRTTGVGQSCHCDDCILNHKDVKHDQWYELIIVTNTSTVSSQKVADSIEAEFNLDEEQVKSVTFKGKCKYVGLNEDVCQLHYITYDLELGSGLHSEFAQFENLLSNAYSLMSEKSDFIFSFTVSHPHGCDKHVSYSLEKDFFHSYGGFHKRMVEKNKGCVLWPSTWNNAKVYYNVPACAGSAGAIVITLTRSGIIISLHQSGSTMSSWTKEKNVRHFVEFFKEDEEPDRLDDFGPMIKFPSGGKGGEKSSVIEETAQDHSKDDEVIILHPRKISPQESLTKNLVPKRIVPRRITPRPLIKHEDKEPLNNPKESELNLSLMECKEKVLQLNQVPEITRLKPSSSISGQLGLPTPVSHTELMTPDSKSESCNDERIVSPVSSELQPSFNDNKVIVLSTSQNCHISKASSSNFSPDDDEKTQSSASKVNHEPKTSALNQLCNDDERNSSTTMDDYHEPKTKTSESHFLTVNIVEGISATAPDSQESETSEPHIRFNENNRKVQSPPLEYQEPKVTAESSPLTANNEIILSVSSKSQVELQVEESTLPVSNSETIRSLASISSRECNTLESSPSTWSDKNTDFSTDQADLKFNPKIAKSCSKGGRNEGLIPLASPPDLKLEAHELSLSPGREEQRPLPVNQPEENPKALRLPSDPIVRAGGSGALPKGILGVTNPGMPESEVCYGPEAHLPLLYVDCEKNPGHENFFHLGELKLAHLPEKHREEDILENIHHTAALTVKVKTSYVSKKRPEAHPHTGDPYLFSEQKGEKFLRVGTGFVVNVQHEKLKYGQTCRCIGCASSQSAKHEHYKIMVMTATHVVFDQAEANRTEIEFSYYQTDKEIATKLLKGKWKHCVINEDACWLEYSTHDEILASKLGKSLEQFQTGKLNLSKNKANDGFVTVVSHPHGSTKQHVSFGNILSEEDLLTYRGEDSDLADTASKQKSGQMKKSPAFRFYHPYEKIAVWPGDLFKPLVCQQIANICYTTPTCRGSSGALVCIHKPGVGNVVFTHWGCGDDDKYNKSGGGTVFYLNDNQIFPD